MKNFLFSFALLFLSAVGAYSQEQVTYADYEGPLGSYKNAIMVPAGNDKMVAFKKTNQLLCYDANLKITWQSKALRKGQQFIGDLTVHHDTVAAFVLKPEDGTKREIIALQRYSLSSGQLINEQKVSGMPEDRPKGFPVCRLSPDRKSIFFVCYDAVKGADVTFVDYTRFSFAANTAVAGKFEVPLSSGKLGEPAASDEGVVVVGSHGDTESNVYIHNAGADRVITRKLNMPDNKHVNSQLYVYGQTAYVVVQAENKDHLTQSLKITSVALPDGAVQTGTNLTITDKMDFMHLKNLHVFPNGWVCLFIEPSYSRYAGNSGTLEEYTQYCGNIYYFITDEKLQLVHQGKIEKMQKQTTFGNITPPFSHVSQLIDDNIHIIYSKPKDATVHVRLDAKGRVATQTIGDGTRKTNFNVIPPYVYLDGERRLYAQGLKAMSMYLVRVNMPVN